MALNGNRFQRFVKRSSRQIGKNIAWLSHLSFRSVLESLRDQFHPIGQGMFYSTSRKGYRYAMSHHAAGPSDEAGRFKVFPHADGAPSFFWQPATMGEQIEVEVDRGQGSGFMTLLTTDRPRFNDDYPLPRLQTKWLYRARPLGAEEWKFSATITVPVHRLARPARTADARDVE